MGSALSLRKDRHLGLFCWISLGRAPARQSFQKKRFELSSQLECQNGQISKILPLGAVFRTPCCFLFWCSFLLPIVIHNKGSTHLQILVKARRFAFSVQDVLLNAF